MSIAIAEVRNPVASAPGFVATGTVAPRPNTPRAGARVADSLRRPTGIAFSPDGQTLYVADRDGDVTYAYPVEGPGRLGPGRKTLFITARDKVYTLPMKVAGGG